MPASTAHLRARFGRARADLIALADAHTRAVQAWLASRSPTAARFAGQGITAVSTGLPISLLNLALGCHFPPPADDTAVAAEIAAVQAFFAARGVPWLWWIGPQTSPADPAPYLAHRGITAAPRPLPAMIAPPPDPAALPAPDPAIRVWRAASLADLQAASAIRRLAFRFPAGAGRHYFEDMAPDWLDDAGPARLFLAGDKGETAVAIGAVITAAGLPGIYVMATRPGQGRRGFGTAVLAALLRHVAAAHPAAPFVTLTASRFGYPLYARFGFTHLFDYAIYEGK